MTFAACAGAARTRCTQSDWALAHCARASGVKLDEARSCQVCLSGGADLDAERHVSPQNSTGKTDLDGRWERYFGNVRSGCGFAQISDSRIKWSGKRTHPKLTTRFCSEVAAKVPLSHDKGFCGGGGGSLAATATTPRRVPRR